jgi:subtilisin-like proprotein convertase family protein
MRVALISLIFLLSLAVCHGETQSIKVSTGWNLVALQVEPVNPAPDQVFQSLGSDFLAAWHFDRTANQWSQFSRIDDEQRYVMALTEVHFAKAYWIYMSAPRTWQVSGSVPDTFPDVPLQSGWNLVGFPSGTELDEQVSLQAVLAAAGLEYDLILRWESGVYQRFTHSDEDVDDFSAMEPNRAYWLNVTGEESHNLSPALVSSVRADSDIDPIGNYPSFEDVRISNSAQPLGPGEQTHIRFELGEDSQQLAISNDGGGLLLWRLEWAPDDASTDWLYVSAAKGVTTIENDIVTLSIDRTHLAPGTYTGTLYLQTTAGNRQFQVEARIPPLAGDWRGSAVITSVNGKLNAVPDVDLHVSFYEDPTIPGLLRGVIDRSQALLWPVDVALTGYSTNVEGTSLNLSGAYILEPGDLNNPPYSGTFGPEDVDWLQNGIFDDRNPFPWPIYRSVGMTGRLVSGTPDLGYIIEGAYSETIYGLTPKPIHLTGTFRLARESLTPFARRSSLSTTDLTSVYSLRLADKPTNAVSIITGISRKVAVPVDMSLCDLKVSVQLSAAEPDKLKVSLQTPDGQTVVLHDRQAVSPETLADVTFPSERAPFDSLDSLINNGNPNNGDWTLILENTGGTNNKFLSWTLELRGQPVFSLSGKLTDLSDNPLQGEVYLSGQPGQAIMTEADGSFIFNRLAATPVNLSGVASGFLPGELRASADFAIPTYPAVVGNPEAERLQSRFTPLPALPMPQGAVPGFEAAFTGNELVWSLVPEPIADGEFELITSSLSGPSPLRVDFKVIGDLGTGQNIQWSFGDDSTDVVGASTSISHVFETVSAEGFVATVTIDGDRTKSVKVYPTPSPGHSPYALNIFWAHFSAGGSLPAEFSGPVLAPSPSPLAADLITVQHARSVSFDLDLYPFVAESGDSFFSDGFPSFASAPANRMSGFKDEDFNYYTDNSSWSLASEAGYGVNEDNYDQYPTLGDLEKWRASESTPLYPRYQIICNVGPRILPSGGSVAYFPGDLDAASGSVPGGGSESQSRYHILRVGPLAIMQVKGDTE